MLILTLLHPVEATPVQSWNFEQESVIRVGRAVDNHVVLYSAVVSRYHVELRQSSNQWEVVNLGTNGTYLREKRVHQAVLEDGSIIRLARSGPLLRIRINPDPDQALLVPELEELNGSTPIALPHNPTTIPGLTDSPEPSPPPSELSDPS